MLIPSVVAFQTHYKCPDVKVMKATETSRYLEAWKVLLSSSVLVIRELMLMYFELMYSLNFLN